MIITICIFTIIIGFIIFIKTLFDKNYINTQIYSFMKRSFWICIGLLPIVISIFIKDLYSPQIPTNASNSYTLGIVFITLISPIIVIIGFLIGHVVFLAIFMIIDLIISKFCGNNIKFIFSILLTTLVMIFILEFIWWEVFYSEGSIPIRIYVWNITILTLPWMPIIGALAIQKWKQQKFLSRNNNL